MFRDYPHVGIANLNKGGNPEYCNQQEYGAIAKGAGENPLNGKGIIAALMSVIKK